MRSLALLLAMAVSAAMAQVTIAYSARFRKVAEKEAPSTSVAHLQKIDPEEWIRHLEATVLA